MPKPLTFESLFEGVELDKEVAKKLKKVFNTSVNKKVFSLLKEAACDSSKEEYSEEKIQELAKTVVEAEEDEVPAPEVGDEGNKSAAEEFLSAVDSLTKDMDIRRLLRSADIQIPEFIRMLKAVAGDLDGNKLAEPMIIFMGNLFKAIANDSTVSARLAQSMEPKAEPAAEEVDPEMEEAEEVEEEKIPEDVVESLITNLDTYITYIAEQYIQENKLELEDGIKVQLAEAQIAAFNDFLVKHNVKNIPTTDLTEQLEEKVKISENKLNKQMEENAKLLKENKEAKKKAAFLEFSAGMPATQREKLEKLAEEVTFESKDEYVKQLGLLKENLTVKKTAKKESGVQDTAVLTENEEVAPKMKKYLDVISSGVAKW